MYSITLKEYKKIRSENYHLIVFENDYRILTYTANLLKIFEEIKFWQGKNKTFLIFNENDLSTEDSIKKEKIYFLEKLKTLKNV